MYGDTIAGLYSSASQGMGKTRCERKEATVRERAAARCFQEDFIGKL